MAHLDGDRSPPLDASAPEPETLAGHPVTGPDPELWWQPEIIIAHVLHSVERLLGWENDSRICETWLYDKQGWGRIQRYWDQGVNMLDQGRGYDTVLQFKKRVRQQRQATQENVQVDPLDAITFNDKILADRLLHLALREATLIILLTNFDTFGEASPWADLERADQTSPHDTVHQKLQAIAAVLADPQRVHGIRSNAALFRKAAESAGLRYENDPADTFARDLRPKFPRRFGRSMPRSIHEWEAFLSSYPHGGPGNKNGQE